MADKYQLKVTAGPSYAPGDQQAVLVNSESPTRITSSQASIDLTIRVQNYRGASLESLPTSPYFSVDPHRKDLYSLQFSFVPKAEINGHDLVLGNDFDHPIRGRLPPGFDQALKIVQWFIDPGLYGDVRADKPFMYGPMLSSVNTFRVDGQAVASETAPTKAQSPDGPATKTDSSSGEGDKTRIKVVDEGALDSNDADAANGKTGASIRKEFNIPSTAAARKKHFLTTDNLKDFVFRKDVRYSCDFFNPYLDFNDFALKLPGFGIIPGITIPIIKYWDGQPLRYVLKNRSNDQTLFVVVFTLIPKDPKDQITPDGIVRDAEHAENAGTGKEETAKDETGKDETAKAVNTVPEGDDDGVD